MGLRLQMVLFVLCTLKLAEQDGTEREKRGDLFVQTCFGIEKKEM